MMAVPRLQKYAHDLRTFPRDATSAWHSAGGKGVWDEVRRRTLDRLGGYTARLLVETDLTRLADIPSPEGLEIREFAGPDWSAMGQLVRRAGHRQAAAAAAGRVCLVAWREGQAVGCAWFSGRLERRYEGYDLPMPADTVYIWQVEVVPEERRRGVAAALVASGLQRARTDGSLRGWAIVDRRNRASLRSFAKLGPSHVVGSVARLKVGSWMRSQCRPLPVPIPTKAVIVDAGSQW
jgi:GNAT superfamily N-acetyltransferase